MEKRSTLDLLLTANLPDLRKELPTKEVELPRLSNLTGEKVIFALRALTYRQVRELQDRKEDASAFGILYGCTSPDWKDPRWLDPDHGIVTPVDAIKARLLPGEIGDLFAEIQLLTGYLRRTISDVKNA